MPIGSSRSNCPLFTVVIPTLDRPDFLRRAVQSVLAQTQTNFELLIVDDGSSSECRSAFDLPADDRIQVFTNRHRLGAAAARNVGVSHARGKMISFLDDDDEFHPSFLAETERVLAECPPEVGFSWCAVEYVDYTEHGSSRRWRGFSGVADEVELFAEVLSIGTGFGVTIKTECFRRIGIFDGSLQLVEDTEFFLRLLSEGFVPRHVQLTGVRIHNHLLSRMTSSLFNGRRIDECMLLLSRYGEFFHRYPRLKLQLENSIEELSRQCVLNGSKTTTLAVS